MNNNIVYFKISVIGPKDLKSDGWIKCPLMSNGCAWAKGSFLNFKDLDQTNDSSARENIIRWIKTGL